MYQGGMENNQSGQSIFGDKTLDKKQLTKQTLLWASSSPLVQISCSLIFRTLSFTLLFPFSLINYLSSKSYLRIYFWGELKPRLLLFLTSSILTWSFPGSSVGKESTCSAGDLSLVPGSGRSPAEGKGYPLQYSWASLVAQAVKNPPAMLETWI